MPPSISEVSVSVIYWQNMYFVLIFNNAPCYLGCAHCSRANAHSKDKPSCLSMTGSRWSQPSSRWQAHASPSSTGTSSAWNSWTCRSGTQSSKMSSCGTSCTRSTFPGRTSRRASQDSRHWLFWSELSWSCTSWWNASYKLARGKKTGAGQRWPMWRPGVIRLPSLPLWADTRRWHGVPPPTSQCRIRLLCFLPDSLRSLNYLVK